MTLTFSPILHVMDLVPWERCHHVSKLGPTLSFLNHERLFRNVSVLGNRVGFGVWLKREAEKRTQLLPSRGITSAFTGQCSYIRPSAVLGGCYTGWELLASVSKSYT